MWVRFLYSELILLKTYKEMVRFASFKFVPNFVSFEHQKTLFAPVHFFSHKKKQIAKFWDLSINLTFSFLLLQSKNYLLSEKYPSKNYQLCKIENNDNLPAFNSHTVIRTFFRKDQVFFAFARYFLLFISILPYHERSFKVEVKY